MAAIAIRLAVRPHLIAVAAISLAVLAAIAAFAQTPAPVTLSGLFDPDFPEIRPDAIGKLKDAIKKAHRDCYPPRVKFTVVTKNEGDPLFVKTLGDARVAALQDKDTGLPSLGLEPGQFKVVSVIGVVDGVLVSYDKFKPEDDNDSEAPKLKFTSIPKEGTKVKAGDKIKVTIKASERYEDGQKSWPTGVYNIQLTADDGLVDSKDYGRPTQPCERRTFEATYTVPRNPPPIVHLTAIVEDGVGHKDSEVGKFPTVEVWHGTDEHFYDITQPPSDIAASNHSTGRRFFTFDLYETSKGKLEGQARATLTSLSVEISEGLCKGARTIQDPETVAWDAQLTGTVQHLSDGSTEISFRATPFRGPSYNRRRIAVGEFCKAEVWHEEDAYWNGFNFTLKPGQDHYDQHRDLGLGGDGSTGQHYEKIHVESSGK